MQYSKYQKAVFKEIESGVSNIVIEASAGSAKTTTIIKSLDYIDPSKKVLFIAFNTSIVAELKEKVGEKDNVNICTMHSLGRSLLKQHGYPVELNVKKYDTFITNNSLFANITMKMKEPQIRKLIRDIKALIGLCRNYMARTEKEIKAVADRYDISHDKGEAKIVKEALKWGKENVDCIDFDDMIWLPNVLNLLPKYACYDYIFLDEAQDANNAQIELFLKFRKNGTRMITVGDKDQSIYNFRGVDGSTFDKLKAMPNTISLPLPISYRCPVSVVKYAQQYSEHIEPYEHAEEGEVNFESPVSKITDNAMVLCRTNAPLMKLYLTLLHDRRKAYLIGNDGLFKTILDMASNSDFEELEAKRLHNGFIPQLYKELFDKKDKWCTEYSKTEDQIFCSPMFRDQYDIIQSAEVLCNGLRTTSELIDRVNEIMDSESEGIRLSTVHKAKGMEADDVFILCNSLMPSKFAKSDWEIEEERHIQYVAYTRAKKTLNFISEMDFSDFTDSNSQFITRMHSLELDINAITHRTKNIKFELTGINKQMVDTIIESASTVTKKSSVRKANVTSSAAVNYGAKKTRRRR